MSVTISCPLGDRPLDFANIAAVVFDKDGTLADTAAYLWHLARARAQHLSPHNRDLREALLRTFGVVGETIHPAGLQAVGTRQENLIAAAALVAGQGQDWISALERAEVAFAAADQVLLPKARFTPPFAGVIDLVERLYAAGCALAVLSGDRGAEVKAFLRMYELDRFFQRVMGSDSPPTKPDPTPLKKICAELAVPPAQTIVIGDADSDGLMAQRAGAAGCIGVSWGWQHPLTLQYCHCMVAKPTQIQVARKE